VLRNTRQSSWDFEFVVYQHVEAQTSQMCVLQQNEERWLTLAEFVIRDIGSCKLFVQSHVPKNFILGQLETLANLKKFVGETTLPAPGIFAHQKRSPNRQKVFVAELRLAAIAATLRIGYRFARSLQR
jgi:hypothetical protein